MFRNLFLLIALGLVVWIIQGFIRRGKQAVKPQISSKAMVQCEHCQTYLPKGDAVSMDARYFCNQQHLQDWNKSA